MIGEKKLLTALAYDIAKIISGGKTTDDSPYALRQILSWIRSTYSDWLTMQLKEAQGNGEDVNPLLLKRYACVGVRELPHGECPCDPKGGKVYVVKLPPIASLNSKPIMRYVGAVNFAMPFREATATTAADVANMQTRFLEPSYAWFMGDGKLYIVAAAGKGPLKAIGLMYLPEDPTQLPSLGAKNYRVNIFKLPSPYTDAAESFIRNKVVAKEGFWTKSTEPTRDKNNNANPE